MGVALFNPTKAVMFAATKLDANGTVNIHLHDRAKDMNLKASTDGMFRDVKVNRVGAMRTSEDKPSLGDAQLP